MSGKRIWRLLEFTVFAVGMVQITRDVMATIKESIHGVRSESYKLKTGPDVTDTETVEVNTLSGIAFADCRFGRCWR